MRKILLCALMASAGAALADPVDFSAHIVDLDGRDIPMSQDKGAPALDLRRAAEVALLAEPDSRDPRAPPRDFAEKSRRFDLALRIHDGGKIALTAEEVTLLKTAIAASFGPLIVGRAIQILDPAAAAKPSKPGE